MSDWKIFTGQGEPHDRIDELPPAPSWRKFDRGLDEMLYAPDPAPMNPCDEQRGKTFCISSTDTDLINVVNAAMYLRRPLLITGKPGTGKTSLAYRIAYELQLGAVLSWPITARSTLQEGLYRYDAIARLQDVQIQQTTAGEAKTQVSSDIGQFIQLGSLGTALLPSKRPRVVLIDEFDKSDINLPNDLLNLFEEGQFEIPELARMAKQQEICKVRTVDDTEAEIRAGKVRCVAFPLIVLTSNGERDFPPAFLRRCLRLTMKPPEKEELMKMVEAHLGTDVLEQAKPLVTDFVNRRTKGGNVGDLSTDQLLNIVYLVTSKLSPNDEKEKAIFIESISKYLSSSEDS
jgi:MoxR-like ATPase